MGRTNGHEAAQFVLVAIGLVACGALISSGVGISLLFAAEAATGGVATGMAVAGGSFVVGAWLGFMFFADRYQKILDELLKYAGVASSTVLLKGEFEKERRLIEKTRKNKSRRGGAFRSQSFRALTLASKREMLDRLRVVEC